MHITAEPRDGYAVLHLRGEFDTYYVPLLQEEIEGLIKAGVNNAILNLRLVRFINSTALGAMIKASKQLGTHGGKLAIARPSKFCRDIIEKVGLDRVIPVFDNDEEAAASLASGAAKAVAEDERAFEVDQSSVMFSPVDADRVEHFVPEDVRGGTAPVNPVHGHSFGGRWRGIGRMSGLDEVGVRFTWNGGNTDLSPFAMAQFLAIGTAWKLKFHLPLFKKGFCEAIATISEVEERPEGVKVRAAFSEIDGGTRSQIKQYATDMAYLKDELPRSKE